MQLDFFKLQSLIAFHVKKLGLSHLTQEGIPILPFFMDLFAQCELWRLVPTFFV